MKKTLLVLALCAIFSVATASPTQLSNCQDHAAGVFTIANHGFSSMTWAYDDTSKTSFTLEGYGFANSSSPTTNPICTVTGDLSSGVATNVSVVLDNTGAVGAWDDLYNGTYVVSEAEFTDYGDSYKLLMTAADTADGDTANQIINDGCTYDRGFEFQAQSWVVDDYDANQFTNARLALTSKPVPEPATLGILGLGGLIVALRKRK